MYYAETACRRSLRSKDLEVISRPYLRIFMRLTFILNITSEKETKIVYIHLTSVLADMTSYLPSFPFILYNCPIAEAPSNKVIITIGKIKRRSSNLQKAEFVICSTVIFLFILVIQFVIFDNRQYYFLQVSFVVLAGLPDRKVVNRKFFI